MNIIINSEAFKQADILFDDIIYRVGADKSSDKDLQKIKLLEARLNNPDFELELANFICGEAGNHFPYRSSYYITQFFQNLGYSYHHNGTTRRFWVQGVLLQMNIHDISNIIEKGLFDKHYFKKKAKEESEDYNENFELALTEFRRFINESLEDISSIDLSYLLDLNINTELLFEKEIKTDDVELDKLIKEAKNRFFNPQDKQIALEKLWDAFERLKTYFGTNKKNSASKLVDVVSENFDNELIGNEFTLLTKIGNDFRIRHHEVGKKEITGNHHIDYLFFRMLSLITLSLKFIEQEKNKTSVNW